MGRSTASGHRVRELPRLAALVLALVWGRGAAAREVPWTDVSPRDGGFKIQMPRSPKTDPKRPGRFSVEHGDASFSVEFEPLDESVRGIVARGDRKGTERLLDVLRDGMVKGASGTLGSSTSADFGGHPSIIFTFSGVVEGKPFEATQRVVFAGDRMIMAIAIGAKTGLKKADVDRFFGSFRLTGGEPAAAAAGAPGAFRTVTYAEAVCGRMPPVSVTFSLPSDYVSRSVGHTVEGGCIWGAKDDLDRVTAAPEQGDFSALRRGVFRARVSTNVVCDPKTGVFDQMDGTGEAGIRKQFVATGAKLVTWKKETLGGLPALTIVADLGASGRVYMLYLGNTRFSSNTLLFNYYHAQKRTAADDETWARFTAGIRKAGG